MRNFAIIISLLLASVKLMAQQDPMSTKYFFNTLSYNPAYAGSKGYMSAVLHHRSQWWGVDGGPTTQTFSIHSPLRGEKVGLGLGIVNDNLGPTNAFQIQTDYAYMIPIGKKSHISVGLQASILNFRLDRSKLNPQNSSDLAFDNVSNPSVWLPNFGAGLLYTHEKFYLGFSAPKLLNGDLRKGDLSQNGLIASQYRHYFITGGLALPINSRLVFKPSALVKMVDLFESDRDNGLNVNAPAEFDIDLSLLIDQKLWVGTAFRSAFAAFNSTSSTDSWDIWASYAFNNGLRVGAAFDLPVNGVMPYYGASYELMLGYDFSFKPRQILTPRYLYL
jgi:type IX secretion system PorP/SprF family membrane protein